MHFWHLFVDFTGIQSTNTEAGDRLHTVYVEEKQHHPAWHRWC